MEHLWAPWRIGYIENVDIKEEGCIFCIKPKQNNDRENLIVARKEKCFIILNKFPYNNGHLMIVPYNHTGDIAKLSADELKNMMITVQESVKIIKNLMKAQGFNIGLNLERVAGAGIEDHLHIHIVPRWNGDSNFMPIIGNTKVISEGLYETWEKLSREFKK
jgi:ATP adenylyltransferase